MTPLVLLDVDDADWVLSCKATTRVEYMLQTIGKHQQHTPAMTPEQGRVEQRAARLQAALYGRLQAPG